MRKIFGTLGIALILVACKKDKLTGEFSIFEGNWHWHYTIKSTYNTVFNTEELDTIYSSQYPDIYEVEFLKKGKVHFKKNGKIEEKKRVVFDYFRQDGLFCFIKNNAYRFVIKLNNNDDNAFHGCMNKDSIASRTNINLPSELNNYESYPLNVVYKHFYIKE